MDNLLRLYKSADPQVRIRAAHSLLEHHWGTIPFDTLMQMLDAWEPGPDVARVLRARRDPPLPQEMLRRLQATRPEIRVAACEILGELADNSATPSVITALDDPTPEVRRAAALALARLKDSTSIPALLRHHSAAHGDRKAQEPLEKALDALGALYTKL
jgi:HEAT repeat protein